MSEAQLRLAATLAGQGRTDDALIAADAVLAHTPDDRTALSLKAGLSMRGRRFDEAETAFRALTRHHPDDGRAWLNLGHLLKATGRTDAAIAAYRRSIGVSAQAGGAWWSLADLKYVRLDDADMTAIRTALAAATGDEDRIPLHFALASALGDRGDHAGAFDQLRIGNAARLARAPHDADATSASFRGAEALFTPTFLSTRSGAGTDAADPIFIVGLPRSGSTLVEQILASHPQIEALGELHELHHIACRLPPGDDVDGHLGGVARLPADRLRELGERYIEAARRHRRTDRPFFVDKMPSNWLYTGLIRLILPKARIVDVRRHPMACGFANYAQHYHWGNNFAYDLTGIGRFYADYVRHMAHFDRVAPGLVHRVSLEALTDDLEGEVRRLLAYLALPFDPACLRFHETQRAVHTPSADQVRRPINRDGADRWLKYKAWLQPLGRALGPVLKHYPATPPGW